MLNIAMSITPYLPLVAKRASVLHGSVLDANYPAKWVSFGCKSTPFLAAEAIERYLELEAWQIKEIKQAIKEADADDFVSDAQFAKIVRKYAG